MVPYILVSLISGLLFGLMDGIINGNPLAQRLFQVYKPIAKKSINFVAGILVDLIYGFIMAGIFMLLYNSLPGGAGVLKGIGFAVLAWFFRVAMSAASQWMMYTIPNKTLVYYVVTGLGEMVVLGVLYGLTIKPLI